MSEKNSDDVKKSLNKTLYEINAVIAQSAIEAQERNMRYAQSIFDTGIEVLKKHASASQGLMHALSEQSQNPQEALKIVLESTTEAQVRNFEYAQSVAENGAEVFRSHREAANALMQNVMDQAREQQELLMTLPYVDTYMEMLRAPLANYKKTVETVQDLTKHAMEVAQQSAREGMDAALNSVGPTSTRHKNS